MGVARVDALLFAAAMSEARDLDLEAVTIFKRAMRTQDQKVKARAVAAEALCVAVRAAAKSGGCGVEGNVIHGPHGFVELSDGGGQPFVVRVQGSQLIGVKMPVEGLQYDDDAQAFIQDDDGKHPAAAVAEAVVALFPKST